MDTSTDVNFMRERCEPDTVSFVADGSRRDRRLYPNPAEFVVNIKEPIKLVYGYDLLDATIPSTMFNVDRKSNALDYMLLSGACSVDFINTVEQEIFAEDGALGIALKSMRPILDMSQWSSVIEDMFFERFLLPGNSLCTGSPGPGVVQITGDSDGNNIVGSFWEFSTLTSKGTQLVYPNLPALTGVALSLLPSLVLAISPSTQKQSPSSAQSILGVVGPSGTSCLFGPDVYFLTNASLFPFSICSGSSSSDEDDEKRETAELAISRIRPLRRRRCESYMQWQLRAKTANVFVLNKSTRPFTIDSFHIPVGNIGPDIIASAIKATFVRTSMSTGYYLTPAALVTAFNLIDSNLTASIDSTSGRIRFHSTPALFPNATQLPHLPVTGLLRPPGIESTEFMISAMTSTVSDSFGFGNAPQGLIFSKAFILLSPGAASLLKANYVVLRCKEIEENVFREDVAGSSGIGIFKIIDSPSLVNLRYDFVNFVRRAFHPISQLTRLTFRFEDVDGDLCDFNGSPAVVILGIKRYMPQPPENFGTLYSLNPNYDPDYRNYNVKAMELQQKFENHAAMPSRVSLPSREEFIREHNLHAHDPQRRLPIQEDIEDNIEDESVDDDGTSSDGLSSLASSIWTGVDFFSHERG